MELNEKVYNKILILCEEGDAFVEQRNFVRAIDKYREALRLIPDPKYIWEASTWTYVALGDTYYLEQKYDESIKCLCEALKCPDGLENPFIMLRIGQCFYELENEMKAREYLIQAYMLAGEEIFQDEAEKYFDVIKNLQ